LTISTVLSCTAMGVGRDASSTGFPLSTHSDEPLGPDD